MIRTSSRSGLAFAVAFVVAIGALTPAFADVNQSKIANQVLVETTDGRQTSFIVYMSDQADLSAAYTMKNADARGWYVYLTLKEHADASQAAIRAALANA